VEKILIAYSTTDQHTLKISSYIKENIEDNDSVEIKPISEVDSLDNYNKIIVGASIRYGKHNKEVYEFIKNFQSTLEEKKSAFFSVNIVARKPEKNRPDTNPYLIKFLNEIDWKPKNLAVFAGMLNYQKYSFFNRQMIRFIMWMTKGPTDPLTVIDYTNWDEVKKFSKLINDL